MFVFKHNRNSIHVFATLVDDGLLNYLSCSTGYVAGLPWNQWCTLHGLHHHWQGDFPCWSCWAVLGETGLHAAHFLHWRPCKHVPASQGLFLLTCALHCAIKYKSWSIYLIVIFLFWPAEEGSYWLQVKRTHFWQPHCSERHRPESLFGQSARCKSDQGRYHLILFLCSWLYCMLI